MEITIEVINQTMQIDDGCKFCDESYRTNNVIEGSQNFVKFKFNFTNDWYNLKTFVQFQQGGKAYNKFLDENGCTFLPAEIQSGVCSLMLYGTEDTTIATTNCLTLVIGKNFLIKDASSTEISKPLYNQLIDEFNKFKDEIGDSADLANKSAQAANEAAEAAKEATEKALEAAEKANEAAENAGSGAIKIASDKTVGGIKAHAKTESQTLPVGIDEEGFLWISPLSSGDYDSIVICGGDSTSV